MKERTNPKSVAPRKVKGTVLFTVVVVMMVLVVFLMGALALAATASRRASNTYSTAQTQATARAGVDAILAAMQNNVDIASAATEVGPAATGKKESVDLGEIKFSYVDTVTDDDGNKSREDQFLNSLGHITASGIQYVGKRWDINDKGEMEEKEVIKIWAKAEQGTAESYYAAYLLKNPSQTKHTDGESQGFVTCGSAVSFNHTSVYGGAYVGFDEKWRITGLDSSAPDYEEKFKKELAKKEADWEALLPMNKSTDIVYNANDGNTNYELDYVINGSFYSKGADLYLVLKDKGTGMTVWGDLTLDKHIYITTANAYGSMFKGTDAVDYKDIPYIYVEGKIKCANHNADIVPVNKAGENIPLNIYCGSIDATNNPSGYMADIYCYDSGATSVLKGDDNHKLYEWGTSVIKIGESSGSDHVGGSFYTKGNLQLDGMPIGHNLFVAGDLNVTANTVVKGDATILGTITGADKLKVQGTLTTSSSVRRVKSNIEFIPEKKELRTDITEISGTAEYKENVTGVYVGPDGTQNWASTFASGFVIPSIPNRLVEAWGGQKCQGVDLGAGTYKDPWGNVKTIPTYKMYIDGSNNVVKPDDMYIVTPAQYIDKDTGSPVSEADAFETVANDGSSTGLVFPPEYEKNVILGKTLPTGGAAKDDTYKIIKTVPEMINSTTDPFANAQYSVADTIVAPQLILGTTDEDGPVDSHGRKAWEITKRNGVVKRYVVRSSCTISGSVSNQTHVVIEANSQDDIWVKIKDGTSLTNGALIVDDTIMLQGENPKDVNILIEGVFDMGSNATPLSDYTLKNGSKFTGSSAYNYLTCASLVNQFMDTDQKYQIYTDRKYATLATGYHWASEEETEKVNADLEEVREKLKNGTLTATEAEAAITKVKTDYMATGAITEETLPWYYGKSKEPFDPPRMYRPILHVYSAADTKCKINCHNVCTPTAYIQAPYMTYDCVDNGGAEPKADIYYNNYRVKKNPCTQIGCYGCMIVNEFKCKNNWVMLYAGNDKNEVAETPDKTDALMRNWRVLYYDNY